MEQRALTLSEAPTLEGAPGSAGTLYLVHVLTHATRARLDGLLCDLGLSSFHYTVLSVVGRHAGLSSSKLSRRFYVSPQAMGEVVALLGARGFLLRSEDPTNRKILQLRLTEHAQTTLEVADRKVAAFEDEVFAGCSERELATFRDTVSAALVRIRGA